MRYQQMQMSLWDALRSLLAEPSPFAPGEIITGKLSQLLFSSFTPYEFWARLPNVLWGAGVIILSFLIGNPSLVIMTLFSVSITTFSSQFRPYSQLIFAGALGSYIVLFKESLRYKTNVAWFCILGLFSHLYGTCFIGLALLLRKRWIPGLILISSAFFWVYIYTHFHEKSLVVWQDKFKPYDWKLVYIMSLETLTDPYGTRKVIVSTFIIGLFAGYFKFRNEYIKFILYSAFLVISPLAANYIGNYWFVPRQIVAGIFPVIMIASIGYEYAIKKVINNVKSSSKYFRIFAYTLLLLAAARSWIMYVKVGRPPFAEQPLHKHKQIVQSVILNKYERVMLLDPGGTGYFYFQQILGNPKSEQVIKNGVLPFINRKWKTTELGNFNLIHFDDSPWAWKDLNLLTTMDDFDSIVREFEPQIIIHNSYIFEYSKNIPVVRCW